MKRVSRQSLFCPSLPVLIVITSIVSLTSVILLTTLLAQKEDTGKQKEQWAGTSNLVFLAHEQNTKIFATTHAQSNNAMVVVHEKSDQTQTTNSPTPSTRTLSVPTFPLDRGGRGLVCNEETKATKVACSILEIIKEQDEIVKKRNLPNAVLPVLSDQSSSNVNNTNSSSAPLNSSSHALVCYIVNSLNAQLISGMDWTFDSTNPYGLGFDWIYYTARKAMDVWQANTAYYLWGNAKFGTPLGPVNTDTMNAQNGFKFGILDDGSGNTNSILAVTITWFDQVGGVWKIVRWNQIYNTGLSNQWGDATQKSNVYDLPGIFTHEIGHSFGVMDIYPSGCSDVTMFYRGDLGETKKRTPESSDIIGERNLYGGGSRSSTFNKVGANEVAPPVYGSMATPAPSNNGGTTTTTTTGGTITTTRPKTNGQHSVLYHLSLWFIVSLSIVSISLY